MVHLLCVRLLWLLTMCVHSPVPFWSVTRPASLPDPRCTVLSAHCSLPRTCTLAAPPMAHTYCRASSAGSSFVESRSCGALWPQSVPAGRCLVRPRHPEAREAQARMELPLIDDWTRCPLQKKIPCCEVRTRSRQCCLALDRAAGRLLRLQFMHLELRQGRRLWGPKRLLMAHPLLRLLPRLPRPLERECPIPRRCKPFVLMLGQDRRRSRCLQEMAPEAPWWSPCLTTWPSRSRSRFGLTPGRDDDHGPGCAGPSAENLSCIRIACCVPSPLLPAVRLQPIITPVPGLMSAMQPDSDYESLCVQASWIFVVHHMCSWSPIILLHSGGGPARGRLSCPACYQCWLSDDCAAYWRSLPSRWCWLLHGQSASGPSSILQTRCRYGRCAAPFLTVWRTAVLPCLFSGTPAVAEDNPWSDSWVLALPPDRMPTSSVQEGWACCSTFVVNHACRCLRSHHSGSAHNPHILPTPSPNSPSAWPVLMAPKLRRWRYKPGQRERRERREARARAEEASSYGSGPGEPPLTLYHPRFSSSSGFEEEEYVEVLVEDELEGLDQPEETLPASHPPEPKRLPRPKTRPRQGRPVETTSTPPLSSEETATDAAQGQIWQDGAIFRRPSPSIWFEDQLPWQAEMPQSESALSSDPVLERRLARREACRSPWPRWRYAAPARLGTRPRVWRVGSMARLLKRPWNKHWRLIFQSCHAVWQRWQGGEPQTADTYFWLANAYRLVYHRSLWPRIQNHLLGLDRFASCQRTCELIRSHRRAERHSHSSAQVTKYMLCCPSRAFPLICCRMLLPLILGAQPAGPLAVCTPGIPHDDTTLYDSGCKSRIGVAALVVFRGSSMFRFGRPAFYTDVLHVTFSGYRDRCAGLHAALAGGRDPQNWRRRDSHVPLTCTCTEGWPHVLLCSDESSANARSYREPCASASLKCFVCRYDGPVSSNRRRPGRTLVTVGTSPRVDTLVLHSLVLGLCQASGQARWRDGLANVLSVPGAQDQGPLGGILPGPHCHICVRPGPHRWRVLRNYLFVLSPLDPTPRERYHPLLRPVVPRLERMGPPLTDACAQDYNSFNKMGPWQAEIELYLEQWFLPLRASRPNLCSHALAPRRPSMLNGEMTPLRTLSHLWPPTVCVPTWMSWTRPVALWVSNPTSTGPPYSAYLRCFGLRFRSRAYVRSLPCKHPCRRPGRRPSSRCRGNGVLETRVAPCAWVCRKFWWWPHRQQAGHWATATWALLIRGMDGSHNHYGTHCQHRSESYLGPKSQSCANTIVSISPDSLVAIELHKLGATEPRVGNLCRRFSGSARHLLSAEKPRQESLMHVIWMLADTRVPALRPPSILTPATAPPCCARTPRVHCRTPQPQCFRRQPGRATSCRWRCALHTLIFLLRASISTAAPAAHGVLTTPQPSGASSSPTKIAKRAYKRAVARAALPGQGGTVYKGRWQTLRQLQGQSRGNTAVASDLRRSRRVPAQPPGPSLRYLTLNCGGLSSDVYQELLLSLESLPEPRRPHVIAIQETHWREDSATEFSTGPWQVVSSHRNGYKAAGVLILVHRTLLRDATLAHAEPFPGRVLHLRITHRAWALDCVVVYQRPYTWQHRQAGTATAVSHDGPTASQVRHQVWDALHSLLQALPTRHTLLLLGDFNTPLSQHVRAGLQVEDLNRSLTQVLQARLPATTRPSRLAPWQTAAMRAGIRVMWQHYRSWRQAASSTGRAIWQAWMHYAKFKRAHKDFRSAGRQARSAWYQDRLGDLQAHARRKDAHSLYRGVRSLAPKSKPVAVQLRSSSGQLLSPQQQVSLLRAHYEGIYANTLPDPPRDQDMPPLQLTEVDLLAAIRALNTHKAVPAHLAPIAAWKLCAQELIPSLLRISGRLTAAPVLWRSAWWALLPKVAQPKLPKQLRPIGVCEASGRIVGKILQDRLRPYVVAYLQDLPQWAYVPHRGTLDAAIRVQAHCQQVLAACHSDGWTVREARAGLTRPKQQAGGLQVSLDLSAAFDSLEWQHIATALADADVPSDLYGQILEWHRGITYHLHIRGLSLEIAASRGLRQGCLIAPLVWALVTGRFLYLLALETDPIWLAQDVTAYADDFHAGSSVDSIAGLDLLYRRLGSMLDVLTDAGLTVNALKSAALYRFRGNFASRWLKLCLRETKEGSLFRLRTPKVFEFPVVLVHTYLGTKISYHDPRTQTMRYRMQLAQLEWSRLRKVVCSKHGLFLGDRIRIWYSSVPATLLYGLAAAGLPSGGLRQLRVLYMRQLRAILRSPAHLRRASNQDILAQARVPDIATALLRDMHRLLRNIQTLRQADSILVSDRLHTFALHLPDTLYLSPDSAGDGGSTGLACSEVLHHCRYCSECFSTHALCKAHETRKHKQMMPDQPGTVFCRYTHGLDGMPTCRLCGHPFRKWGNLAKHIRGNQCPVLTGHRAPAGLVAAGCTATDPLARGVQIGVLDSRPAPADACVAPRGSPSQVDIPSHELPPQPAVDSPTAVPQVEILPLLDRPSIRHILARSHWHALLDSQEVRAELQHHCPFCRQWCMDTAAIKRHMTLQHPVWVQRFSRVVQLLTAFRRTMVFPCRYCSQTQVNKHTHWRTCIVLQVSCFLHLHLQHDGVHGGSGDVCSGASLLRRGVSIPAADGAQEGEGGWHSGSEKSTSGGYLASQYGHHVCWPDKSSTPGRGERSPERERQGFERGQRTELQRLGLVPGTGLESVPVEHTLAFPVGRTPRPCSSSVTDCCQARIRDQQFEAGQHGVLIHQTGGSGTATDSFQHVRKMESRSAGTPRADGGVSSNRPPEGLSSGAWSAPEELQGERGGSSRCQRAGLAYRGRPLEGSGLESRGGGFGRSAQRPQLDNGCHRGRDGGAQETGDSGQHLPVSVHQGPDEGATNSLGTAGPRDQHARLGSQDLGDHSILDRLFGPTCSRLSLAEGTWRTFAAGALASMVNSLPASSSQPGSLAVPFALSLSGWCVAEDFFGLSQVLQCLLWTVQLDQQRRPLASGLIKHLWHRICKHPTQVLPLRGDLFWAPIARQWRAVQVPSTLCLISQLLSQISAVCTTGEWGLHLANRVHPTQATACVRQMIIPMCLRRGMCTVQDGVDAWECSIGRPCLHVPSETLFLSTERPCILLQGDADADELTLSFSPRLGATVWMPGVTGQGIPIKLRYEIRSLIFSEGAGPNFAYHAMHWTWRQKENTAVLDTADGAHRLLIVVMRLTGQVMDG